jgi:hypothetical protein
MVEKLLYLVHPIRKILTIKFWKIVTRHCRNNGSDTKLLRTSVTGMDDGDLDGKVRGIVGYSRYPGPPKVRVIRETLETPKPPQELNNNIFLLPYFIFQYPYL